MKALSVKDPWASKIMYGNKTIETRTWRTKFRGEILICCSMSPASESSGKCLGIATLADCRTMIPRDEKAAQVEFNPNLYSWVLKDIRPFQLPFFFKGQLGLFDVNINLEKHKLVE